MDVTASLCVFTAMVGHSFLGPVIVLVEVINTPSTSSSDWSSGADGTKFGYESHYTQACSVQLRFVVVKAWSLGMGLLLEVDSV